MQLNTSKPKFVMQPLFEKRIIDNAGMILTLRSNKTSWNVIGEIGNGNHDKAIDPLQPHLFHSSVFLVDYEPIADQYDEPMEI